MDPLSASISLVEVAHKIKETIDKVSENRTRLRQLAADVVKGIVDIQEFCETHRRVQDVSGARELQDALDSVSRELHYVLRRCEKVYARYGGSRFGKARANFSAWFNRDEIVTDIVRLKEQVQSCHLRFISFSSARTEQNVLLLLYEHRARARQIDSLIPGLLTGNEASTSTHLFAPIDMAEPGDVMYQYFQQRLSTVLPLVAEFNRTRTHWYEVPDKWHDCEFAPVIYHEQQSPTTIFGNALFRVLEASQLLNNSAQSTVQGIASVLYQLALSLDRLGDTSNALFAIRGAAELYGRLVEDNYTAEFLYHLAHALDLLSTYIEDDQEASLRASEEAMAVWTHLSGTVGMQHYAVHIVPSMLGYGARLGNAGRAAEALDCYQNAFLVAQQIPNSSGTYPMIRWDQLDQLGDLPSGLSSSGRSESYRSFEAALTESLTLLVVASTHGQLASYSEARTMGMRALKGFELILDADSQSEWSVVGTEYVSIIRQEATSWMSISRMPSQQQARTRRRRPSVEQARQSLPPS
ncbi:hypothetical protein HGRIS_006740 [Hohenbuehelia grisea]|uniref:Fungal N-terminal domain-containing protein n=1 Tax=Hohenbuehelia grisea TaxID=104357 RepID=A0ABR3JAB1_9AGAR